MDSLGRGAIVGVDAGLVENSCFALAAEAVSMATGVGVTSSLREEEIAIFGRDCFHLFSFGGCLVVPVEGITRAPI